MPGSVVDVTRLEHENICGQIDELLKAVRRIEQELRQQRSSIHTLESDVGALMSAIKKTA
ncbi:MAG TPA: hypothetical protein VFB07_04025 [Vicinamibacterales bacterium]|nr:hypothetical protein [Vicinamibacterales bacterium]